ncbi:MAG TPA: hypothetical protein VHG29_03750 [Novosphingobium sp.]|nr:hypothetical protein [Novosphingobium sp.]
MGLLQIAAATAAGYGLYRFAKRQQAHHGRAAFATGETEGPNFAKVRNAGPEAMRSDPPEWEKTDQESDESFPASDPPGNY